MKGDVRPGHRRELVPANGPVQGECALQRTTFRNPALAPRTRRDKERRGSALDRGSGGSGCTGSSGSCGGWCGFHTWWAPPITLRRCMCLFSRGLLILRRNRGLCGWCAGALPLGSPLWHHLLERPWRLSVLGLVFRKAPLLRSIAVLACPAALPVLLIRLPSLLSPLLIRRSRLPVKLGLILPLSAHESLAFHARKSPTRRYPGAAGLGPAPRGRPVPRTPFPRGRYYADAPAPPKCYLNGGTLARRPLCAAARRRAQPMESPDMAQ